ncbi:MAG: glycosyltransferase [Bacteroidales bacterium]|nr:glycosyltransferase [Lachnoclostridium sp.]MCM1383957.1 glycosyltransferase [Lachnoclostridium sp.]MCM1464666.1 glycosyltransferase [Bacteroidales bacterium]
MDKVSIIIPTYNRSAKLKKSIEGILRQSYENFELLVVDDASTDDTQAVVEAIADERIRYIRQAVNGGASAARNEGVRQADAPLIAFQDSDDIWKSEKLEKQMAYWQEHPEYAMIYCAYKKYMDGQEIVVPNAAWRGSLEGKLFPWLAQRNSIGAPTMLMRKECFLEAGSFDTDLRALEDWDFALRFSLKYDIGYVDEPLVDSYDSPDGVSSGGSAYYESRCKMIGRYKEQMLAEGVFDFVVNDLFQRAQQRGALEEVKKLLMLCLKGNV